MNFSVRQARRFRLRGATNAYLATSVFLFPIKHIDPRISSWPRLRPGGWQPQSEGALHLATLLDQFGPDTETLGEAACKANAYLAVGIIEWDIPFRGGTLFCTLLVKDAVLGSVVINM